MSASSRCFAFASTRRHCLRAEMESVIVTSYACNLCWHIHARRTACRVTERPRRRAGHSRRITFGNAFCVHYQYLPTNVTRPALALKRKLTGEIIVAWRMRGCQARQIWLRLAAFKTLTWRRARAWALACQHSPSTSISPQLAGRASPSSPRGVAASGRSSAQAKARPSKHLSAACSVKKSARPTSANETAYNHHLTAAQADIIGVTSREDRNVGARLYKTTSINDKSPRPASRRRAGINRPGNCRPGRL